MLEDEWSPEQIVGHLRRHHSGDDELAISHETIYRPIYTTRWGVIPQKLCKRLRTPLHGTLSSASAATKVYGP
ncbi:hypothetical protein OAX51_31775 (plasmid) [Rhodococcus erythropolis]